MTSTPILSFLTALLSSALVNTQITQTAWLLIADDAFGGTYRGDKTYHGSADIISGSVTEYTVDCANGMHGCSLFDKDESTSFYFSEVSGTTRYTIDSGPKAGIVACGPSFELDLAICTRSPQYGYYLTNADGTFQNAITSTDSGYYRVFLTSLDSLFADGIRATMPAAAASMVTNDQTITQTITPAPLPTSTVVSQTPSRVGSQTPRTAASASATTAGNGRGRGSGGGTSLSYSGEIRVGIGVALAAVLAAAVALLGWKKCRASRSPEYSPPELYFSAVEPPGTGSPGSNGGACNGTGTNGVYR